MRDLALHFDCSHKIVANLTRLHVKAGQIPDPNQEPYSCHKVLTAHCEILTGASEFLKHSDKTDKYSSLYSIYVCQDLINLLPNRLRLENPIFNQITDSTYEVNKARYVAWEKWVTDTMKSLVSMDAEIEFIALVVVSQP